MSYHVGLGVGHVHAHQHADTPRHIYEESNAQDGKSLERENERIMEEININLQVQDGNSDVCDSDPELDLEDREFEGWNDVESEPDEDDDLRNADLEEPEEE
jgi:hypothetical protein